MNNSDNRSAQVPYAPYHMEISASGGRIMHPATGRSYSLNEHAARLLPLCDGYHNFGEIVTYITGKSDLPAERVETITGQHLEALTNEGLIWWRSERVRHFRVPAPELVYFDITMRCNLSCAHCGVSAGKPLEDELPTDQCLDILRQLAQAGVSSIGFSGGEPLLHPDLMTLAGHAKELGMTAILSTNGMLITPDAAHQIKRHFDHVQVSLDGSTPEIHAMLRGPQVAFTRTVEGIKNLKRCQVPFMIGCVVHKGNLHDIEEVATLAMSLGAESLRLIHFVSGGRGRQYEHLEPTLAELRQLAFRVHQLRKRLDFEISEVNFEFLLEQPERSPESVLSDPISCGGCWSSVTITPQGEVLPCSFLNGLHSENIRDRSFEDIWQNSRLFNYWRSLRVADIGGTCEVCQWLAACKGGCPAANFASGKMFQPHVHCFLTKEEAAGGMPIADELADVLAV